MRTGINRKQREKGATMILMLTLLPLFLIPMVGLAIDGAMCYLVQAKLAGAVDGAALGAGRLLGTPANTNEIATEFLNVNFPTGWWNTNTLTPNITSSTTNGADTINVSATVNVPLLFMRIFGFNQTVVAASAQATRADWRVELVLDRSNSMNNVDPISGLNVFPTMITGASNFVGMFTPGTDQMGLIAFGGSAIVGYPSTRPYSTVTNAGGGPDSNFAIDSTTGPVFTQLNAMNYGSGTGMSEALSMAYIELQKAHNRDFTANGADYRFNAIVLFTDGVPTAMAVQPNYVQPSNTTAVGASTCTYKALQASGSANKMTGWIAVGGRNIGDWAGTHPYALLDLSAYDTTYTLTQWLGYNTVNGSSVDEIKAVPNSAIGGCGGMNNFAADGTVSNWGNLNLTDFSTVPQTDMYGNSTASTDNGYTLSPSVYNGTAYNPALPNDATHLGIAIWNTVDNVGKTIRTQAAMNPIKILTIGYTGNGGTDIVLLKRLANQADSTSFVASPTQSQGQFWQVDNANQLGAVFADVAASLLRLAK
jgi:Flp pilus assembly protein TadG